MSQQFNTEMVNASAEVLLLQRCMYKVDKMNPLRFCHLLSSCKTREMAQHKGILDKETRSSKPHDRLQVHQSADRVVAQCKAAAEGTARSGKKRPLIGYKEHTSRSASLVPCPRRPVILLYRCCTALSLSRDLLGSTVTSEHTLASAMYTQLRTMQNSLWSFGRCSRSRPR
jgi:hypothetical protein